MVDGKRVEGLSNSTGLECAETECNTKRKRVGVCSLLLLILGISVFVYYLAQRIPKEVEAFSFSHYSYDFPNLSLTFIAKGNVTLQSFAVARAGAWFISKPYKQSYHEYDKLTLVAQLANPEPELPFTLEVLLLYPNNQYQSIIVEVS